MVGEEQVELLTLEVFVRLLSKYLVVSFLLAAACGPEPLQIDELAPDSPLNSIRLPAGFSIRIYADNIANARAMAVSPDGTVFVGSKREGSVYALQDLDGDNKAERTFTVATGLNMPSGVAFRNGSLYVGSVNQILRYDNIETQLENPPEPVIVTDSLPSDRHHGWKYIAFGPDDRLYVPVGAPCNICNKEGEDERYASILSMNADGTDVKVYASGVRNTVGFDWQPATGDLWFTDNGRDLMGNEIPPDELNRAASEGLHFGYPFHHGTDIPDPEFGHMRAKSTTVSPVQDLGPHVAAIGMSFYRGTMFPAEYVNQVLIAEHGSWNRDEKIGYRVTLVRVDETGESLGYEVFAEGWLQGEEQWGRPADVLTMADGAILVSDDQAGIIYRISYQGS